MRQPNWSREDHILAFNLYCQIPFGSIHVNNPKIQQLARLLGRSVNSLSLKLANFSRLDPALQARGIRGMPHGAKGEEEIWQEFANNSEALVFESQKLMAAKLGQNLVDYAGIETRDLPAVGTEREALVRLRINQNFFRRRILSAYNFRCCVTGLAVPELLIASHVVPWAEDEQNRLNPRNGLCLNSFHDRAFDRGLMWIETDFTIRFSPDLIENRIGDLSNAHWLVSFERQSLKLPPGFSPDPELLRRHACSARRS